jgi:hypothetical protein
MLTASTVQSALMPTDDRISRRTWLTKFLLLTAAAGVSPELVSANPTKAGKAVVHYRDCPKRRQMCGMCKFFEGGGMMGGGMMGCGMMGGRMMGGGMMAGECEVVEGRISPMGWCDLYAPRA